MTIRSTEISPQAYARVGGLLYLFIFAAAPFGEFFIRGRLIVRGDAAATASNMLGSETLFRIGLAGEMLTCVCDVTLSMILYVLLRPVDRNIALLGAFMRLTFVAVYSVAKLFEVAALAVLGNADYLKAFDAQQLQALSYLLLRLHGDGYGLSLIFFGGACIAFGYLIYRSGYLPKTLGIFLAAGGVGYEIGTFTDIAAPVFATNLYPWILLPALVGELALCLWLIIKGVDVSKWKSALGDVEMPMHGDRPWRGA